MIKESPENKAGRRSAREGEEEPETEYGPDGCFHVMESEMLANAAGDPFTVDDPERRTKPDVVHVMEVRMKGEALSDYIDEQPGIDNTLPEEPLPGKPAEPPLGGEGRSADALRNPKPTQLPADRRGRR